MRPTHLACLVLIALRPACATGEYRIVESQSGDAMSISALADALVDQDVVFLAEELDYKSAHRTHLELVKELHRLRPSMVISL